MTTTSASATIAAARTAETAITGSILSVADALDSLGRQPVQAALETLQFAINNTKARLMQARQDAVQMLAGAFLDFSDLADLDLEPAPLTLPVQASLCGPTPQSERIAQTAAILSVIADRTAEARQTAQETAEPEATQEPAPIIVPAPEATPEPAAPVEETVATAALPAVEPTPEAPLAEVTAPLTLTQAKRLPKAELVEMVRHAGHAITDAVVECTTKRDLLEILEQAGTISG